MSMTGVQLNASPDCGEEAPRPTTGSQTPRRQGLYNPANEKDACGLAMVATLRGTAGHDIIARRLTALRNLEHRGAVGSDAGTGDGAGILTQIPDAFLRAVIGFSSCRAAGKLRRRQRVPAPGPDRADTGNRSTRANAPARRDLERARLARGARQRRRARRHHGPRLRCRTSSSSSWATSAAKHRAPASTSTARPSGCASAPEQNSTSTSPRCPAAPSSTRAWSPRCSSSRSTPICTDERFAAELALVHSRYSTNTFPSWPLAQPFRMHRAQR